MSPQALAGSIDVSWTSAAAVREGDPPRPAFYFLDEPDRTPYILPEGLVRIGRSRRNQLPIRDRSVSRLHCYVVSEGGSVRIFDAGSENGIRVGNRDSQAEGRTLLEGDVVRIGRRKILFAALGSPRVTPPPAERSPTPGPRLSRPGRLVAPEPRAALVWTLTVSLPAAVLAFVVGLALFDARPSETTNAPPPPMTNRLAIVAPGPAPKLPAPVGPSLPAEVRSPSEVEPAIVESATVEPAIVQAEVPERTDDSSRDSDESAILEEPAAPPRAAQEPPPEPTPEPAKTRETPRGPTEDRPVDAKELDRLARAIRDALENYAYPDANPADLEPALSTLVAIPGREAAKRVWELALAVRELQEDLDKSMQALAKRNEKMLATARRQISLSATKRDQYQRMLELSAKKVQIQTGQKTRLAAMKADVLAAVGRLTSTGAAGYLADRLGTERDPEYLAPLLTAFAQGRAVNAIPALIQKLSTSNESLKNDVLETLRAIAGTDAGATRAEWQAWYEASRKDA